MKEIMCVNKVWELGDTPQGRIGLWHSGDCYVLKYTEGAEWDHFGDTFFQDMLSPSRLARVDHEDLYHEYCEMIEEAEYYASSIHNAIDRAVELCPECREDMDWFYDLAEYDVSPLREEYQSIKQAD